MPLQNIALIVLSLVIVAGFVLVTIRANQRWWSLSKEERRRFKDESRNPGDW